MNMKDSFGVMDGVAILWFRVSTGLSCEVSLKSGMVGKLQF